MGVDFLGFLLLLLLDNPRPVPSLCTGFCPVQIWIFMCLRGSNWTQRSKSRESFWKVIHMMTEDQKPLRVWW